MATLHKTRIRQAPKPGGVHDGVRAAGRYYNLEPSLISKWIKAGEVDLVAAGIVDGAPLPIDDASLRKRIATYTPNKDNKSRRTRSRTIPEIQAARAVGATNGHSRVAGPGVGAPPAVDARPATPAKFGGDLVLLNSSEWIAKFYDYQAKHHDRGELNQGTERGYDATIGRFARRFPTLPMDRKTIMDYIDGLKNIQKGGPLSDGSKRGHVRRINTMYRWLGREYGYTIPDLTHTNLSDPRPNAVAIWTDEIRQVLDAVTDHTEYTLVLLLAQTGCRIGELCTIRPECLHPGWVDVCGKPTRNNLTGHRPLPIPEPAFGHLVRELKVYGELVMQTQTGGPRPLAQAPVPTDSRRPIDLRDPKTYRLQPHTWAVDAYKGQLNRLLVRAGVYRLGLGAHSFRRAYEGEFINNGGDSLLCRRIMGHFNKSDMDQLYLHRNIEQMVEYSAKYAPRGFLNQNEEE